MTSDQKTLKRMLVSMAIIIGFSASMHVYLIQKKAIKTHRYEPVFESQPQLSTARLPEPGTPIEGVVIAVSYDQFFLRLGEKVQPIKVGDLRMPEVGQRISVIFSAGDPPQATHISDVTTPDLDGQNEAIPSK